MSTSSRLGREFSTLDLIWNGYGWVVWSLVLTVQHHATSRSSAGRSDHSSLAAKMHASPVNRRTNPNAVDEKQYISVSLPDPVLEEHNITLSGENLEGFFTLQVGGISTRPINANATSHEVAAALR